ncbi:sensor histidine kinase [Hyphomicrobium facile]|uniref:histidine kinase n=1 Tax=Hyphomicrobium facile TaxID=51670 RepID=A0A1I7MTS2_9HYPH|nr:histidine kinase dimerization/phosphoacceptor domain -containing protein [Hyphomicrobium facile]SFV25804.1 Two-component sensor histidine kinase, contains HisKA and HATPase domains [Hyphomicrobium facile]
MTEKGEAPPVVEPRPDERPTDVTLRALLQRIGQQEILAELGVTALQGATFEELLSETARQAARGLRADFCKVLEFLPGENRFLVRAGVGWNAGVVGVATVGADTESPAGFALRTGKAVISNHLGNEERFRTPEILAAHGVKRAMNVILQGDGKPFGVLEVDSRSDDDFVEHDLAFLQGAANILGMAIERERYERFLKAAVDRHEVLLQEINHRVKNSLALVTSMLRLQAREDDDPRVAERLAEASARVNAVARAHERLYQGDDVRTLDLGVYVEQVCKDLDEAVSQLDVQIDADRGIVVATDRAVSSALIVAELITNAAKYAYKGAAKGKVFVRVTLSGDRVLLTVRDEGSGLPHDFDFQKGTSLGMRIITAFTQQLGGEVKMKRLSPGTEFTVALPADHQP